MIKFNINTINDQTQYSLYLLTIKFNVCLSKLFTNWY